MLELGTSGLLEAQLWTNGDMGVRLATWAGLGNITAPSDGSETPVHVSGSLADIVGALSTVTVFGLDGFNGPEVLHVVLSDLGNTVSGLVGIVPRGTRITIKAVTTLARRTTQALLRRSTASCASM